MTEGGDANAIRKALLAKVGWEKVTKKLITKAGRWGVPANLVEDLANDAIVHFLKHKWQEWDYEADPSAFRALLYIMDWKNDARLTLQRKRSEKMHIEADTEKVEDSPPESDRDPERVAVKNEWLEEKLGKLRAGLADAPLALAMVDLYDADGPMAPRYVAQRLGVDVKDVYIAEARIQRQIKRLSEEERDASPRQVEQQGVEG